MILVKLPTKREVAILKQHRKKSHTLLVQDRAHTVLLLDQGYEASEISRILDRDRTTIERWIHSWEETRIASIFPAYTGNTNASKLTDEQLIEIQETLGKPPSETEGCLPKAFWDVSQLKEYLSASYGIVYESERSYHHILAISNLSFKLPEGFDQRRNDKLVCSRMLEIQREIKRIKYTHTIFAADECSLSWETEYRKAWLPKGQKTILKVNREKIRQNYFGALNLQTKKEELIRLSWQNTETMIEALRELTKRYTGQKLAIIWDNARWHRSKELRSFLGRGKEFSHIKFIWLPPYAPDHNPQEHVWKIAKTATANMTTETFEELQKIFENAIAEKKFDYTMM